MLFSVSFVRKRKCVKLKIVPIYPFSHKQDPGLDLPSHCDDVLLHEKVNACPLSFLAKSEIQIFLCHAELVLTFIEKDCEINEVRTMIFWISYLKNFVIVLVFWCCTGENWYLTY
jgi:hypothetical protein